jgi:hypothetical protein
VTLPNEENVHQISIYEWSRLEDSSTKKKHQLMIRNKRPENIFHLDAVQAGEHTYHSPAKRKLSNPTLVSETKSVLRRSLDRSNMEKTTMLSSTLTSQSPYPATSTTHPKNADLSHTLNTFTFNL